MLLIFFNSILGLFSIIKLLQSKSDEIPDNACLTNPSGVAMDIAFSEALRHQEIGRRAFVNTLIKDGICFSSDLEIIRNTKTSNFEIA